MQLQGGSPHHFPKFYFLCQQPSDHGVTHWNGRRRTAQTATHALLENPAPIRLVTSAGRRLASGDSPAGYPLPLRGQPNSAAQQPRPLSRALLTRTAYRFHARFVTVRDPQPTSRASALCDAATALAPGFAI